MKKILFTLIVCFWIALNGLYSQESIKVITYNMMGMKPDTDWENRLEKIIQHLTELDADIIGLQEINQTQGGNAGDNMAQSIVDSLESYFGLDYFLYEQITHTSWNQFDESIGIISKYPVIASNFADLTPGIFPRKVVWNYINTPMGFVNFFTTHLSYMENHNNIRAQQVQEIMDFVEVKESMWPGVGSIITGDFNCTSESDPISLLVNNSDGNYFYSTYKYANPTSAGYTHPSDSPNRKIDYIFLKNNSERGIDTSLVIISESYDGVHYPSDHRGVLTIFDDSPLNISGAKPMPSHFQFIRQFPNPFNPVTTVEFYLQVEGDVEINVYNILGERVKEIWLPNIAEGINQHRLDFTGFSTGMYFIRIGSREEFVFQKCVYLK